MQELLYLEIPTPDTVSVSKWLQTDFMVENGQKLITPDGFRLKSAVKNTTSVGGELSVFVWSVQRTTYLKVFRWGNQPFPQEELILQSLTKEIRIRFPNCYPELPVIDAQKSIFTELEPYYPLTVKYFQKMPNGEYDLKRAYWWEQRWREGVINPQKPREVIFYQGQGQKTPPPASNSSPEYDIIYIGGALGSIHAAVMAKLGYKVLLVERLPFGKMNREWNISRDEIQSLINLGLLTNAELAEIISREYKDGFNKFFDGNNPASLKSSVLHTPTVLNIALDSEKFLTLCGQKLQAAGGDIWDETEFFQVNISSTEVTINVQHLPTGKERQVRGRLLIDAMGTASPIAWQLNGGRAFDSVCPTVGAVIEKGFDSGVWDSEYGDVLYSHGDISRGRQLIWELFPGVGEELTIYLFHYHEVNEKNPGSLLEMYEDFFAILPEYRRCDLDKLVWKKPTFGYIPGHFSTDSGDRTIAVDRLIAIGDAASLQSPLVFTGFGSLVRNLERLTTLLNTALKHDLLSQQHLNKIRAYQSNVAVMWLFSKGMMVPTSKFIAPQMINSMLNTFFGLLIDETPEVTDNFIKDRCDWFTFNRLALKAAMKNPTLLLWIWQLAGWRDLLRWLGNYVSFTRHALVSLVLGRWFPQFLYWNQSWLENHFPGLWLQLLVINYAITTGRPRLPPALR
ncbi:flavin-dependent dehydrogenase [Aphanizomenon flos-aquae NRERC-008]|uniref:Flavin-dependent dehydrogenase n=1 Tax=Aphanizomenon flos-aquae FACHB-1249 TaxID=2692889 RepID=A0ABR8IPN3_APHFL|nr:MULTISPECIES: flavin-dependent dehydrogenase [Aphanizomenon]MBD2389146.1 flavin-dependent dehydrogenase [Aphanizomenon flos-aquae FACHB-1171]MBD2556240.1 flavin-dependent dehydrogenase [Aphanizomenon flos-aquae FACHB-1290]MBD2630891.1 flavin-dependent dehydrogenase [Aphanizomenon sp. FACHB-1399]MBD2641651.1 flavin-dependent dehydrogenase [Aphanizomenon sp. FACHB-1401]MBD2656725.1 flavin-dependent dehydrogenase [Aphanizomenon flos-aquae FACHB-1265]